MESPVRKMLKRNDYNRHKLFRKIKRRRKAAVEQQSKAAEKELKRRLRWTAPKFKDGKDVWDDLDEFTEQNEDVVSSVALAGDVLAAGSALTGVGATVAPIIALGANIPALALNVYQGGRGLYKLATGLPQDVKKTAGDLISTALEFAGIRGLRKVHKMTEAAKKEYSVAYKAKLKYDNAYKKLSVNRLAQRNNTSTVPYSYKDKIATLLHNANKWYNKAEYDFYKNKTEGTLNTLKYAGYDALSNVPWAVYRKQ